MLRSRRFRRLTGAIYVSADVPVTHALLARAVCLAAPQSVLSDASAVIALGLPLGVRELQLPKVQLTVPAGSPRPDRGIAYVHRRRLDADEVTRSPLGPVTTAARTFVDRAAELELPDLVSLGDAILRRRLATPEQLAAAVKRGKGRRGVERARRALPLLDPRAASPMESYTRAVLVLGGCPMPEVNADIYDVDGCWIAQADLVWPAARLIVEYDGGVHLSERQRRADLARRNDLMAAGWTVLYASADDVLKRPWQLIARVQHYLTASAA
jgi:hypothetical protein